MWNSAEVLHFHFYSAHGLSDRVCDICGVAVKCPWNSSRNLEMHKKTIHFKSITKYPCEKCGKTFSSKEGLKFHDEVQHLGIKRFQCDTCGYKSGTKHRLEDHIKTVHTKEPFLCKHCGLASPNFKSHRVHVTKVHAPIKSRRV